MKQARLDEFVTHLRTRDLSRYTVTGYRRNVAWFFAWLKEQTGRDMPLAEVTTFDLQRYRDHLIDAGRKPSTINRRLAALRAFFAWAAEQDHTAINPAAGIKSIQHKRRAPKGLSKQQVYLLQRHAAARRQLAEALAGQQTVTPAVVLPRWDEAILSLLVYTGLRVSELVDRNKPLWSQARQEGLSRIAGSEMTRINIEASAALEQWIGVMRDDWDRYLSLMWAARHLPMPQKSVKRDRDYTHLFMLSQP